VAQKGDFLPMMRMYWPNITLDHQRVVEATVGRQGELTI
jgi:hypothetical protein